MTHMTLQAVRQLIANDSYAITFQSFGQYRTALLRHFDSLVEGPTSLPEAGSAEGEAPQAEVVADANRYVYLASTADWSAIEDLLRRSDAESATELKRDLDKLVDARLKTAITLPLYTAPAAQHAESDAPALEGLTRYSMWSNSTAHGMDSSPTGPWVSFDDLQDALVAQSQGAQPNLDALDQAWKLGLKADVDGWADLRAQQAAAPGSLRDAIMRLPCKPGRAISMNGASLQAYKEGHRDARHAAAELATSAPGTPEAPADLPQAPNRTGRGISLLHDATIEKAAREVESAGGDSADYYASRVRALKVMAEQEGAPARPGYCCTCGALDFCTASCGANKERAAQLDGGQGGEKKS